MKFKLVVKQGPSVGEVYEFLDDSVAIGRERSSEIALSISEGGVSRKHARITQQGNQFFVEDLGSSNGTYVNGVRISSSPTPLQNGARIQLGRSVTLRFESEVAAVAAPVSDSPAAATIIGEDLDLPSQLGGRPQLTVTVAGGQPQMVNLEGTAYSLGRAQDNDIVITSDIVSRKHCRLEKSGVGFNFIPLKEASNPVLFEGRPLRTERRLQHGDVLRIGGQDPGSMVTIEYQSPTEAAVAGEALTVMFGEKNELQLGRDPTNDVVLNMPSISRFHAQVERVGQRYRVRDLQSSNGTFVNDERVDGEVWLHPNDAIRIGPYRFVLGEDALAQYDESTGLRADAIRLNKWVRKDLNILQDISVVFKPREFIVVVGQSGGGKSTLLDAIAGYRPATHGRVLVNDVDVYSNFDAIRTSIGYVPQRDIIHLELTPYQALDYAAKLRMPPDTTKKERHARIMQVLEDLDMVHRKDVPVKGLSGGQQKRVSIGVELLTEPGLFFLDEPTSGLDPGTETSFMHLMRRLADQGRTIVLVTHATKNVMLADKVVFLARGGHLAWFGPPDEALRYFDGFRTDREQQSGSMEFDKIYSILDDSSKGSAEDWATRFQQHQAYQTYILQPLSPKAQQLVAQKRTRPKKAPKGQRQVSSLRQFFILSQRNLKILTRDRTSLVLMLTAAPLVSMLDVLLAFLMGGDLFNFETGSMENLIMVFFLLVIFAVFVGGLSQMREIVKETDIYRRERLVNLKIFPYVYSKVWIAGAFALYHGGAYTIIHYLAYDMPGGTTEFIQLYITMALLAFGGMMLGLFVSALAPNANTAPMLVILFLMPQVVLSGALVPLPGTVSAPASTRWGFEAMMAITGSGSDVAADQCWQLSEELRDAMSLEEKNAQCNCLGINTIRQESCDFPGIGQFYQSALDEPEPIKPDDLGPQPSEPIMPPAPAEPEDQSDQVAMAEYFQEVQDYQDEVAVIQDGYKAEMKAYEAEAEIYRVEMTAYQEERTEWEVSRTAAIEPAEGFIQTFFDDYGWTFVDKNNTEAYLSKLLTTWVAQIIIFNVLIIGVLIMVKRKDVI